jgi:hypothetical protein
MNSSNDTIGTDEITEALALTPRTPDECYNGTKLKSTPLLRVCG